MSLTTTTSASNDLLKFINKCSSDRTQMTHTMLTRDIYSFSTNYDYIKYKSENEPEFNKLHKFLSEVQTTDDKREYLLLTLASALRGIPNQKFHVYTGRGGNGKLTTINLFKDCMDDYYGSVPVSILTQKRGKSGNATPELVDKNGKRFLVIQEPEHNNVINTGQMKEFTGKDTIMARALYSEPFYFTPTFKFVLIGNELPDIPADDEDDDMDVEDKVEEVSDFEDVVHNQ